MLIIYYLPWIRNNSVRYLGGQDNDLLLGKGYVKLSKVDLEF